MHAPDGSALRELAHLTESRRTQLVGCPFSMLDGKAELMSKPIAVAVQACPDGANSEVHERHCRATVQTAFATFPLHASVGGKALGTPSANLPAVTDVDGSELRVPDGLRTLGEALASPGTSGPAQLVTLDLRTSLTDGGGGLHVGAALATSPSDRVVALRILRAMSNLRSKRMQCSLNMNRTSARTCVGTRTRGPRRRTESFAAPRSPSERTLRPCTLGARATCPADLD